MPQLRQDPIVGYWVAFSHERSKRPLDFARKIERLRSGAVCSFCPGNEHLTPPETLRISQPNGDWLLRVVPNKYPALVEQDGGVHEVIIESPLHLESFGQLPEAAPQLLLAAAVQRFQALRRIPALQYVELFKNSGPGSGASLAHPHSQLLALPVVPSQLLLEWNGAERGYAAEHRCVFCDLGTAAARAGRLVYEEEDAVVLAPFAPRFAYEIWVLPREHISHFESSSRAVTDAVGSALHKVLKRLEELYPQLPFNLFLHTAPFREPASAFYHWHLELLPRLGDIGAFEFGTGCFINTVTPEYAAARMRGDSY